jgi:hypothetical protein
MHMKVARDQFEMRDETIVHVPTGATFRKGAKDIIECDWGAAGEELPGGHGYHRDDITEVAHEIFVITRARPIG